MNRYFPIILLVFSGLAFAQSPYAGQETRTIKSLSPQEIEGYLNGSGMGFAKAAELNGYPGPKHVLELGDELQLTDDQRKATEMLVAEMKQATSSLGAQLVEKERELNDSFATGQIDPAILDSLVGEIGRLRSAIRFAHLDAHLEQTAILTAEQVKSYMQLRGYGHAQHDHRHHQQEHATGDS